MTQVTLDGLTKRYGGVVAALPPLSLKIASGTLTAVLGPSGCGKSTALRMIAGLLEPSGGDVRFDGRSVLRDAPDARGAVMVFQNALLFAHMTVAQNVGFGLRMQGVAKAEVAARVAEMLALVQLPDFGARKPSALSGGQQQRVALARALIVRPRVLLLDEPLSALDAHLRGDMRDLIARVQRDLGITTIFVTHDQEEAVVLADRVAVLLDGRLQQYDAPDALYARPASEAVARFFGGQNFVPGVVEGVVFRSALGDLMVSDARQGQGVLTIRPEAVRLGEGACNTLRAVVTARSFMGAQTQVRVQVGAVALTLSVSPDVAVGIGVGQTISINLPPQNLWVMER